MRLKIYGPPGSGKTTSLAALARNAVGRHGSRVLVASLTKAAAAEIAGRNLGLPTENVGTLHHHCYRLLGHPPLVVKHLAEWNEIHPRYALGADQHDEPGDQGSSEHPGEEWLTAYDNFRQRMRPRELWDSGTLAFAAAWESWKRENALFDFTDLLEEALRDPSGPPDAPTAGIFDEVQDFSRLEFALVEKWATELESVAIAGDDDQCIYSFRAADPAAMLSFACDEERVLTQSYRLPHVIHALSQRWIAQVEHRMPKVFSPQVAEGWATASTHSYAQDADLILQDAQTHVDAGRTVMILATCEYMLRPIVAEARRLGIPFHNPYRRRAHQWNPLYVARGISASQRLLAYLRPRVDVWGASARMWHGGDVALFAQPLRADLFRGRQATAALVGDDEVSDSWIAEHLTDYSVLDLTTSAYERHILPSEIKRFVYPLTVAERDPRLLLDEPRLVIGTVHSVKGGEADVVYLSTELSPAQDEERETDPDHMVRLFYVGMTRAREGLVIVAEGPRRPCCDGLMELVA